MIEIINKRYIFKVKEIWFSRAPFDIQDCDSVIFRDCIKNIDINGFLRIEFPTLIIDLTKELDVIWKNMHKSSCKYAVRKAQRDGVKVRINQNYEQFLELNREFRKQKDLPEADHIINSLRKFGVLFTSEIDGELLGGNFFITDKNNIRWLFSASRRMEVSEDVATVIGNANKFIIWESIKYAKKEGKENYDMGGYHIGDTTSSNLSNINKFKLSFGGELVTHYIYKKDYSLPYIISKKLYNTKNMFSLGRQK